MPKSMLLDILARNAAFALGDAAPATDRGYADHVHFPFLAIVAQQEMKTALILALTNPRVGGVLLVLASTPEIYLHEWVSFSTKDYPENHHAVSGDRVRIVITDIDDGRPVEDVVCTDEDYRALFVNAGLRIAEERRPLGQPDDPCSWVNEARIAPWVIYVLVRDDGGGREASSSP